MTGSRPGAWTVESASGQASCDACGRAWQPASDTRQAWANASRAAAAHARACPANPHTVTVTLIPAYREWLPACRCGWTGSYLPAATAARREGQAHLDQQQHQQPTVGRARP